MWRCVSIILTFMTTSALTNILLERCRNNLPTECNGIPLDCQNIHIVRLEISMLHINMKIECLSLRNTYLTSIEKGAFEFSTSLKYLDLQGNMLSHLDYGLFAKLTELEYLDLSNNSLTSLTDERIFISQEKLKVLKLSSNRIHHVDAKILTTLKAIKSVNLSDNPFHCDCQVLEILNICRIRGLNTSVICEEPAEFEGFSWEITEDICKENLDLMKSFSGENDLVPKYRRMSYSDSAITTILLISLIVVIVLLICVSTVMSFYIRKNKNKIQPKIEDSVKYCAATSTQSPEVHHGTPYIVDIKLKGSCTNSIDINEEPNMADVFKENLIDTEVLVRSNEKHKHVENVRYSGNYDNVCSNVKF